MNTKAQYKPEEYWEKRLNKHFSLESVGNLGFSLEYNIWLYKAKLYVLRRLLKERGINCQGKKILDIGAGTGFYIDFWGEMGAKNITGIDITTKAIDELKEKYPNYKFMKADISCAKLSFNGKYDIITAFDVLFHIVKENDFSQAIENIRKLSHKNTIILITDNFLKEFKPSRGHEHDRTLEYYKKILKDNSLEMKDIRPIFYFMNTPIDIERINSELLQFLIRWTWRTNRIITDSFREHGILGKVLTYFWACGLYCLDRIILKHTSVGPSTKLLLVIPGCERDSLSDK